jgi:hypothetical protein
MKVVIFVGPTISPQEAGSILEATYLPPAKQADVIGVVYRHKPDVIGIIDGVIETELSVWHKEILYALDSGAAVYGAAALGALRAVELAGFGMTGVGEVYRTFQANKLEDDDEVMVSYRVEKGGYLRLSESMVNLRATFKQAAAAGIITADVCNKLIAIARSLYYPQRTFPTIFEKAGQEGVSKNIIEEVKAYVSDHYVDVQKQDARELLQRIANLTDKDIGQRGKTEKPHGALFRALVNRDRKVWHEGVELPLYYIANYLGINHPGIGDLNFSALNRQLALFLADMLEVQVSEDEVGHESRRFRNKHALAADDVFSRWLSDNDIGLAEFRELMHNTARIRRLQKWLLISRGLEKNTPMILDELRLANQYTEWKAKTANIEKIVKDKSEEVWQAFNNEDLEELLNEHLRHTDFRWHTGVPELSGETGFSRDALKLELAREKVARRTVDALLDKLFFSGKS